MALVTKTLQAEAEGECARPNFPIPRFQFSQSLLRPGLSLIE